MTKTHTLGHRLLCFVLCLVCLLMTAAPAAALEAAEETQYTQTTLVYYQARYSAQVIGQMEEGTKLTVLDQSGDFYKVDCYDMTGYIAKSQVSSENGEHVVRCDPQSVQTRQLETRDMADALPLRAAILALADKQLGSYYAYGGMSPGGFDCSGLVYYLFGKHDIKLQRCADEQMQDGLFVAREGLLPGDLVFFRESGCPYLASHVGIYVGDNRMIHSAKGGVQYTSLDQDYYARFYVGARRIIHTGTAGGQTLPTAAAQSAAAFSRTGGIRNIS